MTIPRELFRKLEYYLHNAKKELRNKRKRLELVRRDCYSQMPSGIAKSGGGGFSTGLPEKHAIQIVAQEQEVLKAETWLKVSDKTRKYFAGCKEYVLFQNYYGKNISVNEFAKSRHYDRQTIDNYRDRVVSIFALIAVEEGLVKTNDFL